MNKVNLGSNYTHRVTLRLNDEQYNFLISVSELLGVSPSDYMRMTVNAGMVSLNNGSAELCTKDLKKGTVGTDEDVKTNSNDII